MREAWQIFIARPLLWLVVAIIYVILLSVSVFLPIVNLLFGLINLFFVAGVAYIAYQIDVGEETSIGDLFIAFQQNAGQQVVLFLLSVVGVVLLMIPMALMMFFAAMSGMASGDNPNILMSSASLGFWLLSLLAMMFFIPLVMAIWLAPILILFHELSAWTAMKLSFKACLRNILPMFVLGVVLMICGVIALIPFGLGYLVMLPVSLIVTYVAYKDILIGQIYH